MSRESGHLYGPVQVQRAVLRLSLIHDHLYPSSSAASRQNESSSPLDVDERVIPSESKHVRNGEFSDVRVGEYKNERGEIIKVAIKALRGAPSYDTDLHEKTRSQLYKHGKQWANLRDRNILEFYGISNKCGYLPGLVSPWCENGNVIEFLSRHEKVRKRKQDVFRLLGEIASGLRYLHRNQIVHGDLRGANIMISDDGEALIADFGLTFVIDHAQFTTHKIAGPARWTAPELLDVDEDGPEFPHNTKSDVFAFGMTVLEIMTLRQPFSTIRSDSAVILKMLKGERPELTLDMMKDERILGLVSKCWAGNPNERPETQEVCEVFEEVNNSIGWGSLLSFGTFWSLLGWTYN